ncbi:MAG: MiaB/RimO family radical SAM methylthiotransferase [Coriobacteriales bacterium]|nr:MiaB/RimO family radical SAM methylthiotransferase [Coriobacteriales bacterium]
MGQRAGNRVALINLGCRVNRVETDAIARGLEDLGCVIVDTAQADAIVVNTCAVTAEAQTKTRKAVRRASRMCQEPIVVATGCAATLFADELRSVAPRLVVEPRKDRVVQCVAKKLGLSGNDLPVPSSVPMAPTPTGRTRPGIKIQDGCDLRCSYCIVWKARGPSRSMPAEQVVDAVRDAVGRGAHEVVLTGINLGRYRAPVQDSIAPGAGLNELLRLVLARTHVDRIRLSSIEPQDVTDGLLHAMAEAGDRVAPFLHVCLQSGCDATLGRMRRAYTTEQYASVVKRARDMLPHVALGTDVIVGFPGETDEEFAESLAFCEEMDFSRMHVFRYSKRPGTPAATASGQVPAHVSARRGDRMRAMAEQSRMRNMRLCDGTCDHLVVQGKGEAVDSRLFPVQVDDSLPVGSYVRAHLAWSYGGLVGTVV